MSTMAKENNVVDVSRCRAAEAPVGWRAGGGGGKVERGTRTEALRFDSKTFDVSTVNTCIFAHIRNLHTHAQGNLYVSTSGICAELLEGE